MGKVRKGKERKRALCPMESPTRQTLSNIHEELPSLKLFFVDLTVVENQIPRILYRHLISRWEEILGI